MRCNRCNREINPGIPICQWCGYDNSVPNMQGNSQQNYQQNWQQGNPQYNWQQDRPQGNMQQNWQQSNPQRNPQQNWQQNRPQGNPQWNSQPTNQDPGPGKPENQGSGKLGADRGNRKKILAICIIGGVVLVVLVVSLIILFTIKTEKEPDKTTEKGSEWTMTSQTDRTESTELITTEFDTGSGNTETHTSSTESDITGNNAPIEEQVKDKVPKNGFSDGTVNAVTYDDYIFDIPAYMGNQVESNKTLTYYPELGSNNDSDLIVVCLTISKTEQIPKDAVYHMEELWEAADSTLYNTYLKSGATNIVKLGKEDLTINGMPGHRCDISFELMGISVLLRAYSFYDASLDKVIMIAFQESLSSYYTYFSDFEKIVMSCRKF